MPKKGSQMSNKSILARAFIRTGSTIEDTYEEILNDLSLRYGYKSYCSERQIADMTDRQSKMNDNGGGYGSSELDATGSGAIGSLG